MRWFEIAPCFIQHVVNAYDADETTIVLDAVRYPWFLRLTADGGAFEDNPVGVLWRYRIDLKSGTVEETQVGEDGIELPRINEQWTGRPYRYGYAAEQPTPVELRGIVRYDWHRGTLERYAVPPGIRTVSRCSCRDGQRRRKMTDGCCVACTDARPIPAT